MIECDGWHALECRDQVSAVPVRFMMLMDPAVLTSLQPLGNQLPHSDMLKQRASLISINAFHLQLCYLNKRCVAPPPAPRRRTDDGPAAICLGTSATRLGFAAEPRVFL